MSEGARWWVIEDRVGAARRVALVYLLALTAAELLTTIVEPRLGLLLHGLLLLVLLLHTTMNWERAARPLLLSLAFAPLIRMLSLSLPLAGIPQVYWYLITSIPLFVAVHTTMRTLWLGWRDVGVNLRAWALQPLVAVVGLLLGYVEYRILRPAPLAAAFTVQDLWLPALILLVSTGFMEELIFRGLMQYAAREALGGWHIAYVSAVFAVLHVGYKSLWDVIFVFAVAVLFGVVTERTESILGVSLAHGLTNIVLFLVAPFWVQGSTQLGIGIGTF